MTDDDDLETSKVKICCLKTPVADRGKSHIPLLPSQPSIETLEISHNESNFGKIDADDNS